MLRFRMRPTGRGHGGEDHADHRDRTGHGRQVEILVPQLENVLGVPLKAVLAFAEKHHLAVKKPEVGSSGAKS